MSIFIPASRPARRKALNVLITGPCGVGMSFISSALAHAACRADYSVRSYRLPRLVEKLTRHHAQTPVVKRPTGCEAALQEVNNGCEQTGARAAGGWALNMNAKYAGDQPDTARSARQRAVHFSVRYVRMPAFKPPSRGMGGLQARAALWLDVLAVNNFRSTHVFAGADRLRPLSSPKLPTRQRPLPQPGALLALRAIAEGRSEAAQSAAMRG